MRFLTCLVLLLVGVGCSTCQHVPPLPEMIGKLVQSVDQASQLDEALIDLTEVQNFDFFESLRRTRTDELLKSINQDTGAVSNHTNGTDQCVADVAYIIESLGAKETWAFSFLDAFGKLPSGVLYGATTWLGSFSQCRSIIASYPNSSMSKPHKEPFKGQYCLGSVNLGDHTPTAPNGTVVNIGTCVPDSCDAVLVWELLQFAIQKVSKAFKVQMVQCHPNVAPTFNGGAIAVILILSVLGAVITIATLYDFFVHQHRSNNQVSELIDSAQHSNPSEEERPEIPSTVNVSEYTPLIGSQAQASVQTSKRDRSVGIRLLLCFSVITNGAKILSTKATGKNLAAIHGIRFISMSWVILGHTVLFTLMAPAKNGLVLYTDYISRYSFEAILNASVSVDTFFLLSGILVSFLLLNALKEKAGPRNINWALVYFHRFWRLTPPYMLIIAAYTTLFHHMGSGPTFPNTDDKICKDNWWKNLLYINNFFSQTKVCIDWTWYLANDMQFFIITPLLVVALYKWVVLGAVLIFSLTLMNMIVVGVLTVENNYPADIAMLRMMNASTPDSNAWFDQVYARPYCRIGPYVIGVALGYILYRTELKLKLPKWAAVLGWIVAFTCCYSVIYGLINVANGSVTLSPNVNAFYASVHRIVWAIGVSWVIFACMTGYGGPVNTFLSWPAMVPLSRLTYMAYLLHPIVIFYVQQSQEQTPVLTDITIAYTFVGHMVMSYGAAFVVSLAFEAPMMALEKVIFPKRD